MGYCKENDLYLSLIGYVLALQTKAKCSDYGSLVERQTA
jgi:hypothetical protein